MDKSRPCGCKGCRTCLICEKTFNLKPSVNGLDKTKGYVYCPFCEKAYPGWDSNDFEAHPNHSGDPIEYPGVFIQLDFLTNTEENELMSGIDGFQWDLSQSGRRKQNFGPKCNFKKRKLKLGDFNGFPQFSKFVQEKFQRIDILRDFCTIEQCSLEYDPEKGASIDPHVDDCWIWGERIVTVNLLTDSVLTMTVNKKLDYYNLRQITNLKALESDRIIRIPMPKRSLLVLYGSSRYDWEHQIFREDIKERRVCLAYREFTKQYQPSGDKFNESEIIFQKAKNFF